MVLGNREQGAAEKHFRELERKVIFLSGSREQRPPPPPWAGLRCGPGVFLANTG